MLRERAGDAINQLEVKARKSIKKVPSQSRIKAVGRFRSGMGNVMQFFSFIGDFITTIKNAIRSALAKVLCRLRPWAAKRAVAAAVELQRYPMTKGTMIKVLVCIHSSFFRGGLLTIQS